MQAHLVFPEPTGTSLLALLGLPALKERCVRELELKKSGKSSFRALAFPAHQYRQQLAISVLFFYVVRTSGLSSA